LADLVQAAHWLRAKGHRFHLAFAGDGPYRATLEKELPHDHFFGFIQGEKLSELYASSDLFVFPSTTETFGNVVLEAFASGLPVVGARKGGVADIVRHRSNGLLAKPNDHLDFARHVKGILDRPATLKRYRKEALATASRYDWPTINGLLISHYEFLIRKYKGKTPLSGLQDPPVPKAKLVKTPVPSKRLAG